MLVLQGRGGGHDGAAGGESHNNVCCGLMVLFFGLVLRIRKT